MSSRAGRIAAVVIGVVALLVGLLWIAQGSGMLAGSAMSGHRMWLYIGAVVAVVGAVLLVLGIRRPGGAARS
jgi:cytochrome bd-type quinol oxidase subunit 2